MTNRIETGTVRLYDAEHEVGYITPDVVRDGIVQVVFFRRNACSMTRSPTGEPVLTITGWPERVPSEGECICYEVQMHSKGAFAAKWYLEEIPQTFGLGEPLRLLFKED